MAAPKAAIEVPRALELRAVAAAITGARARIVALETAMATLPNTSGVTAQIQQQIANLNASLLNLESRVRTLENTGDTETIVLSAGAPISINDAVVPTFPGVCETWADGDPTRIYGVIGIAMSLAVQGQPVTVRRRGVATLTGVSFEPGRAVYAAPGGGLTQYPSYNDIYGQVGVALTETTVWVSPGPPLLAAPGFDVGFEDFMGVPYGIVADAIAFMNSFNALDNGIVVKLGANFVTTRTLREGSQISITNANGVAGDPVIEYEPTGRVLPGAGAMRLTGLAPTVVRS